MHIRSFRESDFDDWLRLSAALFPEHTPAELAPWMREFRARTDGEIFLAFRDDNTACGFVEVASRPYADGCDTSPVGIIEAWFVDPDMRRAGVGRALLDAAEPAHAATQKWRPTRCSTTPTAIAPTNTRVI